MSRQALETNQLSTSRRLLLALEEASAKLEAAERARTEPIAVIGMGCRFPGGAGDPAAFWQLLREGRDGIVTVPPERWDIDAYFDPDPEAPGKMSTRYGGFLEEIDHFDPRFFGISPREAVLLDPQQRLLLEVTWETLESAGLPQEKVAGTPVGVFVGITAGDYAQLITRSGDERLFNAYYTSGNTLNAAAGRLAFVLGLQGPAMAVDTACSSSLVALHLACRSLRSGESRLALAAGVNLMLFPGNTTALSKSRMMAPDGKCKTFDAAANGYVRGEGCGVVLLKRLSEAEADKDSILAVIRATAVNQDGHSSGFTVPNGTAQQGLIRDALAGAGLPPSAIDYIEAHGTGTSLGDPIEVNALAGVFGPDRSPDRPLIVGSVKTNIGHLESAAGIAGLIKTILAVQQGEIPPHLHLKTPNSHIAWDKFAVNIPTEATPWPATGQPRRAGVSSFGAIGTNAHVVVEEAPPPPAASSPKTDRSHHILALSAKTPPALAGLAERYARFLDARPDSSLADVCFSANTGRSHFGHRLCLVAADREEMTAKLRQAAAGQRAAGVLRDEVMAGSRPPKKAFLFTGQGAQYSDMGRELYDSQPIFRQCLEECDRILADHLAGPSLLEALFGDPEASPIDRTAYTQPALFALEYALAQLWKSWGVTPDIVMGHSVGEYVAACVAGLFDLENGMRLIAERGRLMQGLSEPGTMFAVRATEAQLAPLLEPYREQVSLAAVNGPRSLVISGAREAMATLVSRLAEEGIKSQQLEVSHAFHSPLMAPMLEPFRRVAAAIPFVPPLLPVISNLTGKIAGEEMVGASYWVDHVRRPVRFADGMATLFAEEVPLIVEIGPAPVLLGMAADCCPEEGRAPRWLPSLRRGRPDWHTLLESLGLLHASGVAVDWAGLDPDYGRRRLQIPTYAWQRQRYWLDAAPAAGPGTGGPLPVLPADHPLLGCRLDGAPREQLFYSSVGPDGPSFLGDHRIVGECVLPMTAYIEMALAAARQLPGEGALVLEDLHLQEALVLSAETATTMQLVWSPRGSDEAAFEIFSRSDGGPEGPASWTRHAAGRIRRGEDETTRREGEPLARLREAIHEPLAVDVFYGQFEDLGLAYGPSFRTLTGLWRREGEALGRLAGFDDAVRDPRYVLHPAILDVCLHVLKAAFTATMPEHIYLPVSIERLSVHGGFGECIWSHARISARPDAADSVLRGHLRIFDDAGRILAEVEGMGVRRLASVPQPTGIDEDPALWLYELQWQPHPLPPAATVPPAAGYWLVFGDESGTGAALCERIARAGQRCRLVRPGPASPAGGERVDPLLVKDFRRLLAQELQPDPKACLGIIHLWSLDSGQDSEPSGEALRRAQVLGCASVLHLIQAVAPMTLVQWPRLWLVTRGSQALPGDRAATLSVAQAPLWGLARVVALEHPGLRCVRVDLDPAAGPVGVDNLWEELLAPDGQEDQIAFREGRRYVARLARRPRVEAQEGEAAPIVADGSYLITGGLGALGLQAARWLATQGARHLLLTGRTAPSEQVRQQLTKWQEAGVSVRVVQADIAKPSEVHRLVSDETASMPPLRGVIHAAGVLADGLLLEQSWEAFERVLAAKVMGTWYLHRATAAAPLDFFVCYSSLAAILGSPGQGDYAAANAFMDALAQRRRLAGQTGLSINWGPWAEAGMAASLNRELIGRRLAQGVGSMGLEAGYRLLGELLREKAAGQVAVLQIDWARFRGRLPDGAAIPFLDAFGGTAAEAAPSAPPLTERLRGLPLQEARPLLTDHVRSQVATVLGLPDPETLQPRQRLFDVGIDSLMAVELRNRLERDMGTALRSTLLFDYPTLEALADHLATEVLQADEPAADTAADGEEADLDALAQIEDLSESEAEAQLLEELAKVETL